MKRPLALFGLAFLFTNMLSVFMPQGVSLPFAAVFMLAFIILLHFKPQYKRAALICAAAALALLLMMLYRYTNVYQSESLIGETHKITARVTNVTDGFTEDTVNITAKMLTADGENIKGYTTVYSMPRCNVGDTITFIGEADAPRQNSYLYSNYADGIFIVFDDAEVISIESGKGDIISFISSLQKAVSSAIKTLLPRETGTVLAAMSAGDRTALSSEIRTIFNRAGISHVLVVSGLHLSMLSAAFYFCVSRLKSRKLADILTCLFVLFLMLFMGMSASVIRSGIALLLVYSGALFNRQSDVYTSLGTAALLLCLINPYAAVDIGLLLSLSSVTAVVLLGSAQNKALRKYGETPLKAFAIRVLFILLIPIAAALACTPVLICIGEGVSLVSFAAGVIAVALLPFIVVLGLAAGICYYIAPLMFLSKLAALIAGVLVNFIIKLASAVASLPFAFIHIYGFAALCIFLFTAAIIFTGIKAGVGARKSIFLSALFLLISIAAYFAYDYNVVHVTLAGNSRTPSVVITQGFDTAVIFRGSQSTAGVEDVLEIYNRQSVNFTADLRLNANTPALSDAFPSQQFVTVAENVIHASTYAPFRDIIITLHRQAKGCYAVIGIDGFDICLATGAVDLTNEKGIDVYIAGSSEPQNLACDKIAVYTSVADWVYKYDAQPSYINEILIREGTSVIYK